MLKLKKFYVKNKDFHFISHTHYFMCYNKACKITPKTLNKPVVLLSPDN